MATGDHTRIWFPEVVELLRTRWTPRISIGGIIELTNDVNRLVRSIRAALGLKPMEFICQDCNFATTDIVPRAAVTATIAALQRFRIADPSSATALGQDWQRYRKSHRLDPYGQPGNRLLWTSSQSRTARGSCAIERPKRHAQMP